MRRGGRALAQRSSRAADDLEQVRRDLARLREGLDQLPIGVILCDEEGQEVARNQRISALIGDLHIDILVSRAAEELLAAVMQGGPRQESLDLKGPPARSIQIVGTPLPSGGAIAFVEDVSERRQLDAVRRDFVANVNHELRTPVGALSLLADALGEETDPEVIHRLATRIGTEADRARRLIEDLLDFSRIETDEAGVREELSVAAVIDAASQRVLALSEQVQVGVRIAPVDPSLTLVGDPDQLVSALANLLDNALKYSDPGGPEVQVQTAASPDTIDVSVKDEGIGIPSKDLDRIFERFYRVDRARTRRTGGTGLGLAIVRHAATNHGGDVIVESTEGVGTTMTLRLPRRR